LQRLAVVRAATTTATARRVDERAATAATAAELAALVKGTGWLRRARRQCIRMRRRPDWADRREGSLE
jgi:hypothetical protein